MTDTSQATSPLFWSKVRVGAADACWPWTGRPDQDGYGHFQFRRFRTRAHRVAWILANGEIPDGLQVLHRCDHPPCCNPRHLWLGTHLDNMMDRSRKGRVPRGETSGRSRLTSTQVSDIRIRKSAGERARDLAIEYGVSMSTIHKLASRTRWRHQIDQPSTK